MKKRSKKQKLRYQAMARERINLAGRTREDYLAGDLAGDLITLGTGLKIYKHEEGEGKHFTKGQNVSVHYVGLLAGTGEVFDESFSNGHPFKFQLRTGQVIAGWDQGIDMLRGGDRATLFVPPEMGYGKQGYPPEIPGNAELVFYVEVME